MSGARLHTAYRLLLALGGAAALGALPWGAFGQDLGALLQPGLPAAPGGPEGGSQGLTLAVLLLVASASATLTINYPGRADVVLLALPLALAWWALGAPATTLLAGIAALLGNALRRRPPWRSPPGPAASPWPRPAPWPWPNASSRRPGPNRR
jgi:hypothetical protein